MPRKDWITTRDADDYFERQAEERDAAEPFARRPKIRVGDEVYIVNNGQYHGHWGIVARIEDDEYHVTRGSIGNIAPIFGVHELRKGPNE